VNEKQPQGSPGVGERVREEVQHGTRVVGGLVVDVTLAPIGALGRHLLGRTLNWWLERSLLVLVFVRFGLYIWETDVLGTADGLKSPPVFIWAERFIAGCFTCEYFVRWRLSENARRWPRKPNALIDLVSVLPFWIGFFVPVEYLGFIRGLRVLSLLKLYRYSVSAQRIMHEVARMRRMFFSLLYFSGAIIAIFGALIYEVEHHAQPDKFHGVADGFWWGAVTSTTIGYGDLFPITPLGKGLAMLMMVVSLCSVGAFVGLGGLAVQRAFREELAEEGG
jgi:voltage-gated potassium channel